jgi:hypothetical protein
MFMLGFLKQAVGMGGSTLKSKMLFDALDPQKLEDAFTTLRARSSTKPMADAVGAAVAGGKGGMSLGKKIGIGAGSAAAVLGLAYLLAKRKQKDNTLSN